MGQNKFDITKDPQVVKFESTINDILDLYETENNPNVSLGEKRIASTIRAKKLEDFCKNETEAFLSDEMQVYSEELVEKANAIDDKNFDIDPNNWENKPNVPHAKYKFLSSLRDFALAHEVRKEFTNIADNPVLTDCFNKVKGNVEQLYEEIKKSEDLEAQNKEELSSEENFNSEEVSSEENNSSENQEGFSYYRLPKGMTADEYAEALESEIKQQEEIRAKFAKIDEGQGAPETNQ